MLADGLGQDTAVTFGLPYCAVYLSTIIAVTLLASAQESRHDVHLQHSCLVYTVHSESVNDCLNKVYTAAAGPLSRWPGV